MLHVESIPLGPLETNCYILYTTKKAVVIDPGGEPERVLEFLHSREIELELIMNTHLHFDHIQGNAGLIAQTGAQVFASPKDAFLLETELGGGGLMGFPKTPPFSFAHLAEGPFTCLGMSLTVLATPGHSPGSLSFYCPQIGAVFVGDLVFHRSVGRTDFPGSSQEELLRSVQEKILLLPSETRIYPGHGPQTSVGDEALNNPFLSEFLL